MGTRIKSDDMTCERFHVRHTPTLPRTYVKEKEELVYDSVSNNVEEIMYQSMAVMTQPILHSLYLVLKKVENTHDWGFHVKFKYWKEWCHEISQNSNYKLINENIGDFILSLINKVSIIMWYVI